MEWTRTLLWTPGESQAQQITIGPPSKMGTPDLAVTSEQPACMHTLKVGFLDDSYPAERFTMRVRPAARELSLGPIDVPATLAIDAPVTVIVQPAAPVVDAVSLTAIVSLGSSYVVAGSTRSLLSVGAAPVALPPWVTAIYIHDPGTTGTWRDAAAVALSAFGGGRRVPRPRQAVTYELSADGLATLYYQ